MHEYGLRAGFLGSAGSQGKPTNIPLKWRNINLDEGGDAMKVDKLPNVDSDEPVFRSRSSEGLFRYSSLSVT